ASGTKSLDELGLPEHTTAELERFLRQTSGLLLLTGPAGSGKTTTIYACLRFLSQLGGRHIITVEDPAEQIIPGIMQTEVNEARGLTFGMATRHLLRQDPQVLVIGEIRDEETANIAVRAALTGHLVISTLHAGSCRGVFERLQVLCADHSAVASAIELVFNQRLIRRLCRECHGAGCNACLSTGFQGRAPLIEWLKVDQNLRGAIRRQELDQLAPQQSLETSARELLRQGVTNDAEYERIFGL
ncbi:MAG TPA: ATPase, T2SS/T4P/T4SS family, partial [Verrucomicrobiae bacterium]|nr:ATPase, T2SS/T4P/T4SS family [Verrucomicrobiae bacterium]